MPDGFKDKTPEEMREISKRISEGVKRRYASLTPEQAIQENENKRKAVQAYWDTVSPEEKKLRLDTSFLSPEAKTKSTKSLRRRFAEMTDEEKQRRARISFDNPEAIKAKRENFRHMSPEQVKKWTERSFLTDQAHLNSARNSHIPKSRAELKLEIVLTKSLPGFFGYNGKANLNVCIGGRIPDFVRLVGLKQVISVFEGPPRSWADEYEEIQHYNKFGCNCLVVWGFELEDEEALIPKLQAFISSTVDCAEDTRE